MDINTIRGWLGHVSINTTNVYADVDLEMKAKALANCGIVGGRTEETSNTSSSAWRGVLRSDLVRESHRPELSRALEEGVWSDGEPHPQALHRGEPLTQPDRVRIRAWAEVAAHFTITDRRAVDALSPFYVWTPDYAEKRLAWKRRTRST